LQVPTLSPEKTKRLDTKRLIARIKSKQTGNAFEHELKMLEAEEESPQKIDEIS